MKKLILFALGALLMEILAMNVKAMHLPSAAGRDFGVLAAILMLLALFEKPNPDERDRQITWQSSHYAFLTVSMVLTGALIYQVISRSVEVWTIVGIGALIVGKIIGRFISERRS